MTSDTCCSLPVDVSFSSFWNHPAFSFDTMFRKTFQQAGEKSNSFFLPSTYQTYIQDLIIDFEEWIFHLLQIGGINFEIFIGHESVAEDTWCLTCLYLS